MDLSHVPPSSQLDIVFGSESTGSSVGERAISSKHLFVRSQDHLAFDVPSATGRRLSAWEAVQAFGFDFLLEVADSGVAPIPTDSEEPARSLSKSRLELGLSVMAVAKAAGVSSESVIDAENAKKRTPIRVLERIAQSLALDDLRLSLSVAGHEDEDNGFAMRLKQLSEKFQDFNDSFVTRIDEIAWVIRRQYEIASWLGCDNDRIQTLGFKPSFNYGAQDYPAWRQGFFLAQQARELLGLSPNEPINSLRKLVGDELKIPLIQLPLDSACAGATVSIEGMRGIAVNINGLNSNVWVRRATIAHELGHLLWDPDQKLERVRVDRYKDFEENPFDLGSCYVESRANAFAIEFLAPQDEALALFQSQASIPQGVRAVMEHFGVSLTAARYQLWNALHREQPLDTFRVDSINPTDDWIGRESFSLDFYRPENVPESRRGSFTGLVLQALRRGLLSSDSAASLLRCDTNELQNNLEVLFSIFAV